VGEALGNVLPLAVAIAIFPVPIIAVVLIIGSDQGLANCLVGAKLIGDAVSGF
jgi:hypothetical protein